MNKVCVIVSYLLISKVSLSQQVLTLKDAVNIALQNSFTLQIAKNNVAIANINNDNGIAGGLPVITANISNQESVVNINQELNTGTKLSRNGATSNILNANIQGNIVLYNGYRIKTTKQRLAEIEQLNKQQLNTQIQNTIAAVHVNYFDVVRQQYFIRTIEKNIEVAQQRLSIIKTRKDIGLANNADVFQAEIDVNARLQDLKSQQLLLQQSKINLLNTLNLNPDSSINIKDTISIDAKLTLTQVIDALQQNPDMLTAKQQIVINELLEKETHTLRLPTLRANAGINFNRNQANGGQLLLNQNYGPFIGVGLALPLYNGGVVKKQEQIAKLNIKNSQIQQQQLLNNLQTAAVRAFNNYNNNLDQLSLQQKNVALSASLVQLTVQRFELQQATIIELREAQRSFEEASFRFINLSFAAKLSEIELNRLANKLGF
ncbi:MAG: TolC family protein [Chitinophagaceae bacterium]